MRFKTLVTVMALAGMSLGLLGVPLEALAGESCAPCCEKRVESHCGDSSEPCIRVAAGSCCEAAPVLPPTPAKRTLDLPVSTPALARAALVRVDPGPRLRVQRSADPTRLPSPHRLSVVLIL